MFTHSPREDATCASRLGSSKIVGAKAEAMTVAETLNGVTLNVKRHAGEDAVSGRRSAARTVGALAGTVTSREIADLLAEQGFNLDRRDLVVPDNIKALGEFAAVV